MDGAPARPRGLEATEREQLCWLLASPQGPGTMWPEPASCHLRLSASCSLWTFLSFCKRVFLVAGLTWQWLRDAFLSASAIAGANVFNGELSAQLQGQQCGPWPGAQQMGSCLGDPAPTAGAHAARGNSVTPEPDSPQVQDI